MHFRSVAALAALSIIAVPGASDAQVDEARQSVGRNPSEVGIASLNYRQLRYGTKHWQQIHYLRGKTADAPLVVYVPGVDWETGPTYDVSALPDYLIRNGYAFARISFGRVPEDVTPSVGAAEIAAALAKLRARNRTIRFNPERIALLADGSGGYFASLLATDVPRLGAASVPASSLCATITINGDGFDIPERLAGSGARQSRYARAFRNNSDDLARASAAAHAGRPNAGAFLLLTGTDNADAARQADAFAAQLRSAGMVARRGSFAQWKRGARATYVGMEENEGTRQIADFLAAHCPRA